MGHNETQKKEETNIAYMLSEYLSIPFEQFNVEREEPDCEFCFNGKNIGVEFVSIRPYKNISGTAKSVIEKEIRKLIYDLLVENDLYDVAFRIILNYDMYFCPQNIKKIRPKLIYEINEAINIVLKDPVYLAKTNDLTYSGIKSIEYNGELFNTIDIIYYKNANWKNDKKMIDPNTGRYSPIIYFTLGGMRIPVPINYVTEAIEMKEEKYNKYINNRSPVFDECWLCIYIQEEEHLFSIAGLELPRDFQTNYSRVFIVQESNLFPRVYELKK